MDETTYTGPTGPIEDNLAAYTAELVSWASYTEAEKQAYEAAQCIEHGGRDLAACDHAALPERGTEKQGLD